MSNETKIIQTIKAPSLTAADYGVQIQEQFDNINKNFQILSNREFFKGDSGRGLKRIAISLCLDNQIGAKFIEKIKKTVEYKYPGNQDKKIILKTGDSVGAYDYLDKATIDNCSKLYVYSNPEDESKYIFSEPYIFRDARFTDPNLAEDLSVFNNLIDSSGILNIDETAASGEIIDNITLTYSNSIPTLYYGGGEFKWVLNGQKTGIVASGPAGSDGSAHKFWVGRTDVSDSSATNYRRLDYVLVNGSWIRPENIEENPPEHSEPVIIIEHLSNQDGSPRIFLSSIQYINDTYLVYCGVDNNIKLNFNIKSFNELMSNLVVAGEQYTGFFLPFTNQSSYLGDVPNFDRHSISSSSNADSGQNSTLEIKPISTAVAKDNTLLKIGYSKLNINENTEIISKDGNLEVQSTGKMNVKSNSDLEVQSSGKMNVKSNSDLEVQSSGKMNVITGGNFELHSGSGSNKIVLDGEVYIKDVQSQYELTTVSTNEIINKKLFEIIEVTYSQLVKLQDNNKLKPGQQYRIVDYGDSKYVYINDSDHQHDYAFAGHQFDIIVVADESNKLNENARAVQHKGDTYFNGCKLESWEIKYFLKEDSTHKRCNWSIPGETEYRGTIYYMKDEWENECPYDFKNIVFVNLNIYKYDLGNNVYVRYTFSEGYYCQNNTISKSEWKSEYLNYAKDASLSNYVTGNKINVRSNYGGTIFLNRITIDCPQNVDRSKNIIYICNNTFANDCHNILLKCRYTAGNPGTYACERNSFGVSCYNCVVADQANKIGDYCWHIFIDYGKFDNVHCSYNEISGYSRDLNIFGVRNIIGSDNYDNTILGDSNTLSQNCHHISIGDPSSKIKNNLNKFGPDCNNISLSYSEQNGNVFYSGVCNFPTTNSGLLRYCTIYPDDYSGHTINELFSQSYVGLQPISGGENQIYCTPYWHIIKLDQN